MMVSTKGRYALRVMIDLAEHQSEGYVPSSSAFWKVCAARAVVTS